MRSHISWFLVCPISLMLSYPELPRAQIKLLTKMANLLLPRRQSCNADDAKHSMRQATSLVVNSAFDLTAKDLLLFFPLALSFCILFHPSWPPCHCSALISFVLWCAGPAGKAGWLQLKELFHPLQLIVLTCNLYCWLAHPGAFG